MFFFFKAWQALHARHLDSLERLASCANLSNLFLPAQAKTLLALMLCPVLAEILCKCRNNAAGHAPLLPVVQRFSRARSPLGQS